MVDHHCCRQPANIAHRLFRVTDGFVHLVVDRRVFAGADWLTHRVERCRNPCGFQLALKFAGLCRFAGGGSGAGCWLSERGGGRYGGLIG